MKLGIVVILEYPTSRAGCPPQQFQTSSQCHNDTGWKLMRRSDQQQPRCASRQLLDDKALVVRPNSGHSGAMGEQAMQSQLVVRILDDHVVTWVQKHALDKRERLLGTADHQNV